MSKKFVTMKQAKTAWGVNESTLRRWADEGLFPSYRTPKGTRMYQIDEFLRSEGQQREEDHPNRKCATAESPLKIKARTSKGKSSTCKNGSQDTESSPTSDQASTSNERVSEPSWRLQAKDRSTKLWLPTGTSSVDLPLNSLSGSFRPMESNSWFSMTAWSPHHPINQSSQKTSWQSSMFSIAESMGGGSTKSQKKIQKKKKQANKVRKVSLKLTPDQKAVLIKWFGCCRDTYNWALGCIRDKPKEYKKSNFYWLRNRFVNKINIPKDKFYLLDCPKQIRANAI
mmetsp:Transcript_9767/g.29583  ORF Transcript_9767/g.29583 Transcript_9767/m.29583 type:complete len:284 (+) Transcript_9767:1784-2635(+)